ncbi:MAG: stage V sporulation protein SpoVM [Clostridia bacterium]|nr:stage V sporulation protein SpoVM [Clostridia bacterium]
MYQRSDWLMKVVVCHSPKFLSGFLKLLFGIKE